MRKVPGSEILSYAVDFRAGKAGQQFLMAGWSTPESDFTWTIGSKSVVFFPEIQAGTDHSLEFVATPFKRLNKVDFQRVYVEINGRPLARLIYREWGKTEIFVPARALSGRRSLEIVFHLPDAQSPEGLGDPSDSRVLGMAMTSLLVQALSPTPRREPSAILNPDRVMLMQIQSLGENCELGLVQRLHGAEPFGLFRWAATPLPNLLAALAARFEGLGRREYLDAELDESSEYQIFDRKFGFRNHSHAYSYTGIGKEDVLAREAIRLPFLVRLLRMELERANRLFCFHDAGSSSRAQIETLVAALRSYGPNSLLWVRPAATPEQVGTAEWLHEGLICGYIDRFEPIAGVVSPSYDPWIRLLREAYMLWHAGRVAEPVTSAA